MNPNDGPHYFIYTDPTPRYDFADLFASAFTSFGRPPKPVKSAAQVQAETRESAFAGADLQNGDVIRLTHQVRGTGGLSTLQGPIEQIRQVDGEYGKEYQVRLAGFGESPHGTQNIWFGVRNYENVEVVERAYRWTTRDRAIAGFVNVTKQWPGWSEENREQHRQHYGARIDRVLAAVKEV